MGFKAYNNNPKLSCHDTSTPNVVRNRRSKPPTFSSRNNFLRFVGQNPL